MSVGERILLSNLRAFYVLTLKPLKEITGRVLNEVKDNFFTAEQLFFISEIQ